MIKNIIFDIGGVLTRFDPSDYLTPFNFEKEKSKILGDLIFKSDYWKDYMVGNISSEFFKQKVMNSANNYANEIKYILDTKNTHLLLPPLKEGVKFLKSMKKQGYDIYILSNLVQDSLNYFKASFTDVTDLLNGAVYSCEVGLKKPSKDIFEFILNKYNLKPNETLFIDDSEKNILAAQQLGIKGVWCKPLTRPNDFEKVVNILNEKLEK